MCRSAEDGVREIFGQCWTSDTRGDIAHIKRKSAWRDCVLCFVLLVGDFNVVSESNLGFAAGELLRSLNCFKSVVLLHSFLLFVLLVALLVVMLLVVLALGPSALLSLIHI